MNTVWKVASPRARTHPGTAVWVAPLKPVSRAIQATPPTAIVRCSAPRERTRVSVTMTTVNSAVAPDTIASGDSRSSTRSRTPVHPIVPMPKKTSGVP